MRITWGGGSGFTRDRKTGLTCRKTLHMQFIHTLSLLSESSFSGEQTSTSNVFKMCEDNFFSYNFQKILKIYEVLR